MNIVVRAANLVLGAVAALGEALITSDVTTLASFAALPRLGMAPTGRTTTGTSHLQDF